MYRIRISLLSVLVLVSQPLCASNDKYIKDSWKTCLKDSQCKVVSDMGCMNQCQSDIINIDSEKALRNKINKKCADLLVPVFACAQDSRVKIPRCIKGKCQLMTKHTCCTTKDTKLREVRGCHIKKVSCTEVNFN